MTHYRSSTQPRKSAARTHPPVPPLSTLPRSSAYFTDHGLNGSSLAGKGSPSPSRRPYSTSNTPLNLTPPALLGGGGLGGGGGVGGGDMTLTKRILTTAGQTGSTRDLRLLLNDALALTEKLDSVSASVGGRPVSMSASERHRLSSSSNSTTSVFPKSPGAYSEPGGRSSMLRAQSLGNELDSCGRSGSGDEELPSPRYEMSESWTAAMATPLRKSVGHAGFLNGHTSPPAPMAATIPRRGSPLLSNTKSRLSGDYATPRSATTTPSRQPSQTSSSTSGGGGRRSPGGPSGGGSRGSPAAGTSQSELHGGDNVRTGLDYLAQLEALERELQGYNPPGTPSKDHPRQGGSRESPHTQQGGSQNHVRGPSRDSHSSSSRESSQECHYEVDPYFTPSTSQCVCVCVCERVIPKPDNYLSLP